MALRIAAPKPASASVIFLHGLGDSGRGWSFLPSECFQRPGLQHVNFVLPDAPLKQYPAFGGAAPGWFGMSGMNQSMDDVVNDFEGLQSTLEYVKSLVQAELDKGIAPNRIVIGGFSQGAATAQSFATTYKDHKLAGFVSLSGFLPHAKDLISHRSSTNITQPIFLAHGTADPVVPYNEMEKAAKVLSEQFKFSNVNVHSYPGLAHSVDPKELTDLLDFLEKVLN